jgi:hypothetical protein
VATAQHLAATPQTLNASIVGTNAKLPYTFERKRQA